ncbi:MAG: hypothetical protein OSB05_12715 [Akkermansiaceae bacterium]|nr:hypothetical protein [Akkermansiaceae bacterium]
MPPPIAFAFLLFPLLFVGIWCLICKIISLFGWKQLSFRYAAFFPAEGERFSGQSIQLSLLGNYKGCITYHVGKIGLRISVMPIFRVGHLSLFFPWTAVRYLKEHQALLGKKYLYDLGTSRVRRIAVSPEIHRAIQQMQAGAGVRL